MANRRGDLHITYNGEIYNYRELRARLEGLGRTFTSTSDTEVMLEAFDAWGDRALDELNGMFALALYDARADRVLLARDRAGEKPLYYWHRGDRLYFASELKALFADPDVPRDLDYDALNFYLTYGYVPGERCILRGVRKLAGRTRADVRSEDRRHRGPRVLVHGEPRRVGLSAIRIRSHRRARVAHRRLGPAPAHRVRRARGDSP